MILKIIKVEVRVSKSQISPRLTCRDYGYNKTKINMLKSHLPVNFWINLLKIKEKNVVKEKNICKTYL